MTSLPQTLTIFQTVFLFIAAFGPFRGVDAINAYPGVITIPATSSQPELKLRPRGGELRNWLTDLEDYVIAWNPEEQAYTYAEGYDDRGNAVSSTDIAGRGEPSKGIKYPPPLDFVSESQNQWDVLASEASLNPESSIVDGDFPLTALPDVPAGMRVLDTPLTNTGIRNVLCLLLRFKDHKDRDTGIVNKDTLSTLLKGTDMPGAPANTSVRDYYLRNSYEQLDLNFTVLDWIDVSMTEAEAADEVSALKQSSKFSESILEALEYATTNKLFSRPDFDLNNDDVLDHVLVIHSGFPAEMGTIDKYTTPSKDRIWSHRRQLRFFKETDPEVHARALEVGLAQYCCHTAFYDTNYPNLARIGGLAHELAHTFGLPDLYDTDYDSYGIMSYGMMGNAWGFDNSQKNPPSFSAWSKVAMGWVKPFELLSNETGEQVSRSLKPMQLSKDGIAVVRNGFNNPLEYLLIENRQKLETDFTLPGAGLLVWHIDDAKRRNNEQGIPGRVTWPDNHYRVALVQMDGDYKLELTALSRYYLPENAEDMLNWSPDNTTLTALDDYTFPSINAYQQHKCDATTGNSLAVNAPAEADGSITLLYKRNEPKSCCVPTVENWNVTYASLQDVANVAIEVEIFDCEWFAKSVSRCFTFGDVVGVGNQTANSVCCACGAGISAFGTAAPVPFPAGLDKPIPVIQTSDSPSPTPATVNTWIPTSSARDTTDDPTFLSAGIVVATLVVLPVAVVGFRRARPQQQRVGARMNYITHVDYLDPPPLTRAADVERPKSKKVKQTNPFQGRRSGRAVRPELKSDNPLLLVRTDSYHSGNSSGSSVGKSIHQSISSVAGDNVGSGSAVQSR